MPRRSKVPSSGPPGEIDVPSRLARSSLLVLADDEDMRDLIRTVLGGSGATVVSTSTAFEAIAVCKAATFEVVVSDVGLTTDEAFEFMSELRSLPRELNGSTPALLMMGLFGRRRDRDQALALGFQRHLSKPCSPAKLLRVVGEMLADGGSTDRLN